MGNSVETIDIAPKPFQVRFLSLALEWDLMFDIGRGGGKVYVVIIEVFSCAERWGTLPLNFITCEVPGALSYS